MEKKMNKFQKDAAKNLGTLVESNAAFLQSQTYLLREMEESHTSFSALVAVLNSGKPFEDFLTDKGGSNGKS